MVRILCGFKSFRLLLLRNVVGLSLGGVDIKSWLRELGRLKLLVFVWVVCSGWGLLLERLVVRIWGSWWCLRLIFCNYWFGWCRWLMVLGGCGWLRNLVGLWCIWLLGFNWIGISGGSCVGFSRCS